MGEIGDSVGSETTSRRPNSRYSMFSRKYLPRPLSRSRHRNISRDRPSTSGGDVCSRPLPPQSGLFKFLAKRKVGVVVQIDGKQYNITVYTSSPASFVIEEALRRHGNDMTESIEDLEIIQTSTQLSVSKTAIVYEYLSGGATFEIRRFRARESNQDEEGDHHDECRNENKRITGASAGPDSPTRVDNQRENNVQSSVPLKRSLQSKFPVQAWKKSQDPAKDVEQPECDSSKGQMKVSQSCLVPDLLAHTLSERAKEGKQDYIGAEAVDVESAKEEVVRCDITCGDSEELQFEVDVQNTDTVDEIPLCNSAITLADNVKKRNRRISHLRQVREDGLSATPPSTPRGSTTAVLLSTQPLGGLETEEGFGLLQKAAEKLKEPGSTASDDQHEKEEELSSEAVGALSSSITGTDPNILESKARERKNTLKSHISLLHFSILEVEKEILKAQNLEVRDDGESLNDRSTDLSRLKVRLASLKQQLCALQTKKSKLDERQMEVPRKKHSRRHSISSLSSLTSGRSAGLKENKKEKFVLEKLTTPTFCAGSDEQTYNRRSSLRRTLSQTPGKAQLLASAANSTIPSSRRIQRRSSFHCGRDSYVSYSEAPGVGTYNVCTLDRVRGGIFSSTDDKRDSWVGAAGSDSPGVGAYNLHQRPKVKGGTIGDSLRF